MDIAVDDLILILGKQQDIEEDHTYDTSRMEAFLVPAGTAVEVYATTLHYAPCHVKGRGIQVRDCPSKETPIWTWSRWK